MNELYLQLGTYAAVARKVGFSPTTVKKYINTSYVAEEFVVMIPFTGTIISAEKLSLPKSLDEWRVWLRISEEEKIDIEELRKEILL